MANYSSDRGFTNFVHEKVAIPKLYDKIGWKEMTVDEDELEKVDINNGIDYYFYDSQGNQVSVQERFRERRYSCYPDCTLRYRRDNNPNRDRVRSEFYKIEADYLVYGVIDCSKSEIYDEDADFLKVVIVRMDKFYKELQLGNIIIRNNGEMTSYIENGKLICPEKYNVDSSSSFIAMKVSDLEQLWGHDIIYYKKGY